MNTIDVQPSEEGLRTLHAHEDESVNFVRPAPGGYLEARYVRRTEDYFIAYVSSQAGCDRSCRFCHLTSTGQTSMAQSTVSDYVGQVADVLAHHDRQDVRPDRMNMNFMARGEPLLNPILHSAETWSRMAEGVRRAASASGIGTVKFNVSTIMPTMPEDVPWPRLDQVISDPDVTLYYSLYSMDPAFRRRWIPKSVDPRAALRTLAAWQDATGNEVALHWAFIEGENDDLRTVHDIVRAVRDAGLRPKFNAVRFNPPGGSRHREPDELVVERNFSVLAEAFGHPSSRIVPRVGLSVKASCGMFVGDRKR